VSIPVFCVSGAPAAPLHNSEFMDGPHQDDRSIISLAYTWATRVIAVAITLTAPALLGAWIGQKFGTAWTIVLLLLGFALGVTGAVFQLMQIAKDSKSFRSGGSSDDRPQRNTNDKSSRS
jgi:F0F1-type ATP synthase assembly protein I